MNNTFNIQRFGLLLKRQWLEFGRIYLISFLVTLGLLTTYYSLTLWAYLRGGIPEFRESALNFREPLFIIFGFIFVTIIASNYFAHLGQKSKAIIDLLIPASTFEKFLSSIFFTALLAIASFCLLFYLTDLGFISNLRGKYPDNLQSLPYFFKENNPNEFKPIYVIPFFVSSIFLLGSIYFERFHYIKTTISVMIFSGIWVAIIAKSAKLLYEGKVEINTTERIGHSKDIVELWGVLLMVVLTLIFWSIVYVRLKEKQV